LALDLALACALNHFDLDSAAFPDLTAMGFDPLGQGLALLTIYGWKDPALEIEGDHAKATGIASMNSPFPVAAALVQSLPDEIRVLELSARQDESTRAFVADVPSLQRYWEVDAGERDFAFVEACTRATLNGRPFISRDSARHYIAVQAGEGLEPEPAAAIRRLKQLRDFALRLGDEECAEVLIQVIRVVRLKVMGQGLDLQAHQALDQLIEWTETVPEPFAT
jgi:hypothetical protein